MFKHILKTITALLMVCALVLPVNASSPQVKGTLKSLTSYKIEWKGAKKYTYWRIRQIVTNKNGGQSYKTIKVLKRTTKSYTIKKLKKNHYYSYEITGGKKVKGKYKPLIYDYLYDVYTGMSTVNWNDYAASDAPFSPKSIELWGNTMNNGLAIKGFQIYRREKGKTFKKIATVKKKPDFIYKDKTVEAGKTYEYRFRSYGTYNKKTLYSPYSEILKKTAVNQFPTYQTKTLSSSKDRIEVSVTSAKNNGTIILKRENICISRQEGPDADVYTTHDEYPRLNNILQYSTDGTKWTTLKAKDQIKLKGGATIYFAISSEKDSTYEGYLIDDITLITELEAQSAKYQSIPCYFAFALEGTGSIEYDSEAIH